MGIESGVWKRAADNAWVDGAAICLARTYIKPMEEVVEWSDELVLPPNSYDGVGRWSPSNDPHSMITGGDKTRAEFIADAIVRAMTRFLSEKGIVSDEKQ